MKKHYLSVLAALTITTSAFAAPEDYIGAIWATAASYCPVGSLPANGNPLPIAQYQALNAILGGVYGGTSTTFNLPNLNGRTIVGAGNQTSTTSRVNIGQSVGTEQLSLTQAQLPGHIHAATFTTTTSSLNAALKVSSTGGTATPASGTYLSGTPTVKNGMATYPATMYTADATTLIPVKGVEVTGTVGGNVAVSVAGGSQPFDNRQPSLGLTYCITTNGIWPDRP